MRILVVMNLYPPHAYGGYEDLCAGAVRRWRDAGHDVHVLTSTHRRDDLGLDREPVGPAGEPVRRVLPIAWDDHAPVTPSWRTCLRWQRRAHREVRATLRELRPEVVSIWNPGALPFGPWRELVDVGVPVALVVLDRWLSWGPTSDPWLSWATSHPRLGRLAAVVTGMPTRVRRLGAHVTGLFASAHLRDDAAANAAWPIDDRAIAPHGVDLDRYPRVDDDRRSRPWGWRLLYVGRITAEKGITTAVRALAELPGSATLDVVGTGRDRERRWILDLARELDVQERVHLHGDAGPDALRAHYDTADVLVFPSRWQEPFGIVPLEGMARGVPVVATGTGGSGEFCVDELTCLRFAPDDAVGLAAQVTRLADDGDLRARLTAAGRRLVQHLSRDAADEHLLAWHLHLGGAAPRPTDRPVLPADLAAQLPR